MTHKLFMVTWHDAHSSCEWKEKEELDKYSKERTIVTEVGWIVSEDDDVVVVSSQLASDAGFGNMTRIPKGMIKRCKRIYAGTGQGGARHKNKRRKNRPVR